SVVAQKSEGLATGLTSVFAHFAEGHQRRIITLNSDSPHLPCSVLEDAFETLAAHDVVVGPTHDGGYYLVGGKASHPRLFAGDGMGTSSALERLLSRARALELSVGFADSFYDIDVADDLTRLAAELRQAPARAPRTAAWLLCGTLNFFGCPRAPMMISIDMFGMAACRGSATTPILSFPAILLLWGCIPRKPAT